MAVLTDIEIARQNKMVPIEEVAKKLDLDEQSLHKFGHHIAKLDTDKISIDSRHGKLILVTAISPTPAGEGKTTTSVGLNDALNKIGKKSLVCLREPSLGPCFGVKGGAAGGGLRAHAALSPRARREHAHHQQRAARHRRAGARPARRRAGGRLGGAARARAAAGLRLPPGHAGLAHAALRRGRRLAASGGT